MGIEYVNRRGETYYLLQGKTKTGKPKYYVSRNPDGIRVGEMPQGYELYEHLRQGTVHAFTFARFGRRRCCLRSARAWRPGPAS
jgi:hypothetical protein